MVGVPRFQKSQLIVALGISKVSCLEIGYIWNIVMMGGLQVAITDSIYFGKRCPTCVLISLFENNSTVQALGIGCQNGYFDLYSEHVEAFKNVFNCIILFL